jgi:ADP-ribose pyrophosphatase YjhB (NUDIX family)
MAIKLTIRPPDTKNVAKVVMFDGDKVLLLKRKKNQKHPGKWDLPGGHIIAGEDWEPGAKREVEEETNLKIVDKEDLPEHDDFMWIEKDKVEQLNNLSDIYVSAIRKALG